MPSRKSQGSNPGASSGHSGLKGLSWESGLMRKQSSLLHPEPMDRSWISGGLVLLGKVNPLERRFGGEQPLSSSADEEGEERAPFLGGERTESVCAIGSPLNEG